MKFKLKKPNELIAVNEKGEYTARKLYEFLELRAGDFARWCKSNIVENAFALENTDFVRLRIDAETPTGGKIEKVDYRLSVDFAKKLCMTSKTERGEQARNYFIEVEKQYLKLHPPKTKIEMLVDIVQEMARQEKALLALNEATERLDAQVDGIKDVLTLTSANWRTDTGHLINNIANADGRTHREVRNESYDLLEFRLGVKLAIRLENMKKNAALGGAGKSRIEKLNKLDVIEGDKKLIEGYLSVVKDMAIKYGGIDA